MEGKSGLSLSSRSLGLGIGNRRPMSKKEPRGEVARFLRVEAFRAFKFLRFSKFPKLQEVQDFINLSRFRPPASFEISRFRGFGRSRILSTRNLEILNVRYSRFKIRGSIFQVSRWAMFKSQDFKRSRFRPAQNPGTLES